MPPSRLHLPDRAELRELRRQLSVGQMAIRFGCSRELIYYYLSTDDPPSDPSLVPVHVVRYWRHVWGWPEWKIKAVGQRYAEDVARKRVTRKG